MFRLTYSPVVFVLMLAMSVATASAADPCCSSDSPHGLSVSLSGMPVLMDVTGGNGNTKSYTYCIALEGSSDEPPLNAEMTPGDPSWSITNAGGTSSRGSEGTDTYHARWGQTITVSESKTITLEASITVQVTEKTKDENDNDIEIPHYYKGVGSTQVTLTVGGDVTPKPCTDLCEPEECDTCETADEPGMPCPTNTMSYNSPLGGAGIMIFPQASGIRIQNFSHTQGQAEATLDYRVIDDEATKLGFDQNFRNDTKFGNGVKFIRVSEMRKKIEAPRPKQIVVELLQYGPLHFSEPERIVYDTSKAVPNRSYRFSIPRFFPELPAGNYDWQVRLTKVFEDGTNEVSTVMGRQGFFNSQASPLATGWTFGMTPRLQKDGEDILLMYQGMHKFRKDGNKWISPKTYDTSDSVLTGDWASGFALTSKDRIVRKFDGDGRILSKTSPRGEVVSYEYDEEGRLWKKTLPNDKTTTFVYDRETGYLIEVLNPQNQTTRIEHDEAGRIVKVAGPDPDGDGPLPAETLRFTYREDHLVASVTKPNGMVTRFEYDRARRLEKIIHPNGRVESFVCPITAGMIPEGEGTDEAPAQLIATDDIVGTSVIDGRTVQTKYDPWGLVLEDTDSNGNTRQYVRNAQGQILEEIKMAMDGNGKLTPVKTEYQYDKRGNQIKETLPRDRGTRTWAYDPATNAVTKYVDETGLTTLYEIDPKTGNTVKETVLA
ncbi:MAG TPA: hypothetical protein DEB39_15940, partial [Planctomycetaceae bacterium]|nr:hypothetical protein [Planctomycetaceae bacterium]